MNTLPRPCPVTDETLLAYRDDELAPAEQHRLAAHLAACPSCRERLANAAAVTARLQASTPLRDAPANRAAIHAALARQRGTWWLAPALRGATLAVAMVLMIVVGLRWWDGRLCPECDAPPGPGNAAITQIAGLPARFASPALICAPQTAAAAWQRQATQLAQRPQSVSASQLGMAPDRALAADEAPSGRERASIPGAAGRAASVQHLVHTPGGPAANQAPAGSCAPRANRPGSPSLAQQNNARPGN